MEKIESTIKDIDFLALYEIDGEEIEEITETKEMQPKDIVSTLLVLVDDIKEKVGGDLTDLFYEINSLKNEVKRLKKRVK